PSQRASHGHFVDVATLKPFTGGDDAKLPGIVAPLLRASGDGRVFAWRTSTGSEGHEMALLVLRSKGADLRTRSMGDYLLTPGPDGRHIYCISGILNHDWEPVFPRPANTNLYRPYIPAVQGPYFLQLLSFEFDRPAGKTTDGDVVVLQRGSDVEITRVKDVQGVTGMSLAYGMVGTVLAYDQRILFIPAANLPVLIPAVRTKLILPSLDIQKELDRSGQDYLLIASDPPTLAKKGKTYTYPMAVKSKQGGVRYRLESGPEGMKVTEAGVVTWPVPSNFAETEVDVIVSVTGASGKEQFQSFRITVE